MLGAVRDTDVLARIDDRIYRQRVEQARATAGATGLVLLPQVALTADRTRQALQRQRLRRPQRQPPADRADGEGLAL